MGSWQLSPANVWPAFQTGLGWYALFIGCEAVRRFFARWRGTRQSLRRMAAPLPDAEIHPILGILPEFVRQRHHIHDWRTRVTVEKGLHVVASPFPVFLQAPVGLMVSDPTIVRWILKDNFDVYTKLEPCQDLFFSLLNRLLGRGIFTATHGIGAADAGELWTAHRKVASSIFSRRNFNQNMGRVFSTKGQDFVDLLRDRVSRGDALVDLQAMLFAFTMDSVMEIFFGMPANTLTGGRCGIALNFDQAHLAMIDYSLNGLPVIGLLDLVPAPLGGITGILSELFMRVHPLGRKFRHCLAEIDKELLALIRERRQEVNVESDAQGGGPSDLLALFMRSVDPSTGKPFSDRELRDVVLNFLIAGRDTTASLLAWLFYELCVNPAVQEKLAEEIRGACPPDEQISFESLRALPYLNGVVYEALRLHPPIPLNYKAAMKDDVLPNGIEVPAFTRVIYLIYAMGRDPQRYPEPTEFRPERWIPFKEPAPHEFPQFQAGPRICLGKEMALYETKLLVVMLVREFCFKLKEGEKEKIVPHIGVTMNICNDAVTDTANLWIHVAARKQ